MNEQVIGVVMIVTSLVLHYIAQQIPNIAEAKYVDFSKVFR